MTFIVQSPIQKVTNETATGTTEKKIVRLKLAENGNQVRPGVFLKPDTEVIVIVTDPAEFAAFKVGQSVEMTLA